MIEKVALQSSTISKQFAPKECNGKITIKGTLPTSFPLPLNELLQQLQSSSLAKRKIPESVSSIVLNYNRLKHRLVSGSPENYDPDHVSRCIADLSMALEGKQNAGRKSNIQRRLNELTTWLGELDQHQEDAIFLEEPCSYAALWNTDGHIFALRHALEGAYSVVEIDTTAARRLLTHRAFCGKEYKGDSFKVIGKYDRRETLECTTFVKVRKVRHGNWLGIDRHGHEAQLSEAWARSTENISTVTYLEAASRYKAGDAAPVLIMPGSFIASVDESSESNDSSFPDVMYRNRPGEHRCMANALLSALNYLGYPEIAKRINQELANIQGDGVDYVSWFFSDVANKALLQQGMKLIKNGKKHRYNPDKVALQPEKQSVHLTRLVLGKLRGRYGGLNHAVAFVDDKFIFDSNYSKALPLNLTSLNKACDGTGYHSLYWSYRLVMFK